MRRISTQLLERHPALFTENFQENKVKLDEVAIILSKQLKNQIAGYITILVKNQKKAQDAPETSEEMVPSPEAA